MSLGEVCEVAGCSKIASRLTTTETKYIVVCDDCWNNKYRI